MRALEVKWSKICPFIDNRAFKELSQFGFASLSHPSKGRKAPCQKKEERYLGKNKRMI